MYERDIALLACPETGAPLVLEAGAERDADGEIVTGTLASSAGKRYRIANGIPRFVDGSGYNASWDFKWVEIDRGRGLNYAQIRDGFHDNIFDLNAHGGAAWRGLEGALALDLGCGVGQYSVKALRDHGVARMVSVDLTGGVDVFRKIVLERFPELKPRLFLVQANILGLPFKPESFDYVFSLGVLHHTGHTIEAMRKACRLVKIGGEVNVWVYCPRLTYLEDREPGHLYMIRRLSLLRRIAKGPQQAMVKFWMAVTRHLPTKLAFRLVRPFASEVWYRFGNLPLLGAVPRLVFPGVADPDYDQRLINIFDAYVNAYAEEWNEHEIFPVLKDCGIAVKGVSAWRTGFWGVKRPEFYA